MTSVRSLAAGLLVAALSACGGGSGATITVTGNMIDQCGDPVSDISVTVLATASSAKQTVTTSADGTFSFPGVTAPYTLITRDHSAFAFVQVRVYQGLTRSKVRLQAGHAGMTSLARITGDLLPGSTGFTQPPPDGWQIGLSFSAPVLTVGYSTPALQSPYDFDLTWCTRSGTSLTGTLRLLQYKLDDTWLPGGIAPIFIGYGERAGVTISAGATTPGQDLTMSEVAAGHLVVTVQKPDATYSASAISMELRDPAGGSLYLGGRVGNVVDTGQPSLTRTLNTPSIAGTSLAVSAMATTPSGGWSSRTEAGLAASGQVTLTLLPAPSLTAPSKGATGVDLATQAFSWTAGGGGLQTFGLFGPGTFLLVYSKESTVRLPSFTELGLDPIPAGSRITWNVDSGPVASPDELVDPAGPLLFGGSGSYSVQQSETGDFTNGRAPASAVRPRPTHGRATAKPAQTGETTDDVLSP